MHLLLSQLYKRKIALFDRVIKTCMNCVYVLYQGILLTEENWLMVLYF